MTFTVVAEAEIKDYTNSRRTIINHNDDPCSNDDSDPEDDTAEQTEFTYNINEPNVPPKINLEKMVERIQKIINFLSQHNTEQLEPGRLSTSDSKTTFKMAQLKRHCRGGHELTTYPSLLRLNFQTHKHLFHDDTDRVQYALNHPGRWAFHADCDMQKTTTIDPITWGENLQKNNSTCLQDHDLLVGEIQNMYSN